MSAEIIAKLGLDESRFQEGLKRADRNMDGFSKKARSRQIQIGPPGAPTLGGTQSVAEVASSTLERKFGLKDAMKGLFQGIGIGSVDQIARLVVAPFEQAKNKARDLAEFTQQLYEGTARTIGVLGGPDRDLQLKKRELEDLASDIERQRNLVAELNSNPIRFINEHQQALIKEAEDDLNILIKRQADLGNEITITTKLSNRQVADLARQIDLEDKLARSALNDGTAREKLQIKLNALEKEHSVLAKRGAGQVALGENFQKQNAVRNEIALQQNSDSDAVGSILVGAGAQLATRTPTPRKRGRSERERLADRGAAFRAQAEEAIRTGRSPDYVARLARSATKDLTAVGHKVSDSTALVARDDAKLLGSELIKVNQTLQKIDGRFAPKPVK